MDLVNEQDNQDISNIPTVGIKKFIISAVVTRADGTVEDLGVICHSSSDDNKTVESDSMSTGI